MKKNKTKQKNKKDKFKIYLVINSILLTWLSLTTLLILTKYDVLPLKYMLLTLIPLILIPGIFIFLIAAFIGIKLYLLRTYAGNSSFISSS